MPNANIASLVHRTSTAITTRAVRQVTTFHLRKIIIRPVHSAEWFPSCPICMNRDCAPLIDMGCKECPQWAEAMKAKGWDPSWGKKEEPKKEEKEQESSALHAVASLSLTFVLAYIFKLEFLD